jgi:predicted dehydrogenase
MHVGVIGLGWWGPKLVRNFVAILGADHVIGCDLDAERCHDATRRWGIRTVPNPEALLSDPTVQAIAIASPPATHYPFTRRAIEAGKHVLVEKPPAMTLEAFEELAAFARERGRVYMADSTYVYAPVIRALRSLLRDTKVGEVRAVQSLRHGDNLRREGRGRLDSALLRHGIDVVEDLVFHDLAILAYLFEEPLHLQSIHRFEALEPGVADVAYVDGHIGTRPVHVGLSWTLPERRREIVVYTERAVVRADDLAERDKLTVYWIDTQKEEVPPIEDYHQEPLLAMVSHFLKCVDTGSEPETGAHFMRRAMTGFEACRNHRLPSLTGT